MVLTRLWYGVAAVVAAGGIYLAIGASARHATRESEIAAEQVRVDQRSVQIALRLDSRQRLDLLLRFSGDKALREAIKASAGKAGVSAAAQKALVELGAKVPVEYKFSAVFVVDREGRVVGRTGFDAAAASPDMELGGYSAVFDALHGYARDDAWSWGPQVFRVVARPIEDEVGAPPMGAVIGLTEIDRAWSRDVARRTGTNVVFTTHEKKVARDIAFGSASDMTEAELSTESPQRHAESERLLGEAGENGVTVTTVRLTPLPDALATFAPMHTTLPVAALLLLAGVGLLALFLEHDKPLRAFNAELVRTGEGSSDGMSLAKLSGPWRRLGDAVNQAIDRVAAKGGGRKAPDLGALVGAPAPNAGLSAFSLPDAPSSSLVAAPSPVMPPPRVAPPPAKPSMPRATASGPSMLRDDEVTGVNHTTKGMADKTPAPGDVMTDDRAVYEAFLLVRAQCGEASDSLSFDAFKRVLAKHRLDIGQRYPGANVAFSVYVKDGRASLRATPIKAGLRSATKEERE